MAKAWHFIRYVCSAGVGQHESFKSSYLPVIGWGWVSFLENPVVGCTNILWGTGGTGAASYLRVQSPGRYSSLGKPCSHPAGHRKKSQRSQMPPLSGNTQWQDRKFCSGAWPPTPSWEACGSNTCSRRTWWLPWGEPPGWGCPSCWFSWPTGESPGLDKVGTANACDLPVWYYELRV